MELSNNVVRKGSRYEVNFTEGGKSSCSADVVDSIAAQTGENATEIALIVTRIQTAGNAHDQFGDQYARFSNKLIEQKLPDIISAYGVEATLEIVENMKRHEIEQVLKSVNPIAEIPEFL